MDLRNREIRLLEVFARHPGRILSKSHLMDRLFSYDAEVTETVRGLGYRLEPDPA